MPWLVLAWTRAVEPVGRRRALAATALALVAACMLSLAEPVILLASGLGIALLSVERLAVPRAAGLSRRARERKTEKIKRGYRIEVVQLALHDDREAEQQRRDPHLAKVLVKQSPNHACSSSTR